jgi:predicted RND superfamily exporter protein
MEEKLENNDEKLYSVDDIHKIIQYINKNYTKIEDELAKPYEDNREDLPDDFFENTYNKCLKLAIENIK